MLPDRSVLIGQKLVENAKIEKFKCDILGDFQTLWAARSRLQKLRAGMHSSYYYYEAFDLMRL